MYSALTKTLLLQKTILFNMEHNYTSSETSTRMKKTKKPTLQLFSQVATDAFRQA